jgi:membrane-associated phospholipid phosphatase
MSFLTKYAQFVIALSAPWFVALYMSAILATVFLVWSGFDWAYHSFVLAVVPMWVLFAADITGFIVPVGAPLALATFALVTKRRIYRLYTEAMVYAVVLGFTLSTIIKSFTGRTSPPHRHSGRELIMVDNSHDFHFGFMREHVIGGWPSSHATIAFALAVTLTLMLPPRWYIRAMLFFSALFVSVGVTFGFHWISEAVAGACLGAAIGMVIGVRYAQELVKT